MKKRKLVISSITSVLACGVILGVFSISGWFGRENTGFASTLLPEWKYRRPITLSGQTSNLTDYQVKIELLASLTSSLVTDGKLQSVASNFADIRFTDGNDNQLLNFWIETATTTATSTIWVKVPGLSASKSSTIYMYYGNPSASSASNGTNTFEFFDDFPGASLDTTNKWTILIGTPTVNNALYLDDGERIDTKNYSGNSQRVQFLATVPDETGAAYYTFAGINENVNDYRTIFVTLYGGWEVQSLNESGNERTNIGTYAGTHTFSILKILGTSAKYYVDGVLKDTDTTYVPNSDLPLFFAKLGTNDLVINYVFASKYGSPEPTATVGSEQTQMTPIAHWRFDEGTGTTTYDSTPNNKDGTIYGASWTTGKFNKGLKFDGIDDYVNLKDIDF